MSIDIYEVQRQARSSIDKVQESHNRLSYLESELFSSREQIEVLWLRIGEMCAEIVEKKLYRFAQDEDGNYFRTAKAYFTNLDRRFRERGWNLSYTTINQYMADFRLVTKHEVTPEEAVTLGKSNLQVLAPAVRQLEKDGKPEEAHALVREVVEAAVANDGLPVAFVQEAVTDVTGRVMKGLSLEFAPGVFGKKLTAINLWWGERSINLLKSEVTAEQEAWLMRRMGIKPTTTLP